MNIEYSVVRSSRKTLAIQVKSDGSVIVRAPFGVSDSAAASAIERRKEWIIKTKERFLERKKNRPELTKEEEDELIQRAKAYLPDRVAYYSKIMGVAPTKITVTRAKTRFGSCSGKNAVSFSCRVMLYSPEAADYVVVHELAHIKQHNHSPAFWREVEKTLPDFKEREALLRR